MGGYLEIHLWADWQPVQLMYGWRDVIASLTCILIFILVRRDVCLHKVHGGEKTGCRLMW